MPQNSIKDIVKDKYGFIWICTESGILRYDGQTLINYNNLKISNLSFAKFLGNVKSDHIVLNNTREMEYLIIKNRRIFVTKKKSPVLKGETERIIFRNETYVNLNKNNSRTVIDRPFIRFQQGIYFFSGENQVIYKNNLNQEKTISIQFGYDDEKNFFSFGENLFLRDIKNKRILKFSEGNLSLFNADNPLYNDPLSKIFWQGMNDQNFIINRGKIYISEFKNGKLETTPILEIKNSDIDISMIFSLLYDKENQTLYVGTLNKGLNIIKIPSFSTPKIDPTLENRVQYSVLPFGPDKIINFQGRIYDKNSLIKDHHFNTLDQWCLIYDENKNILFANNGKLYRRLFKYNYAKYDSIDVGKGKSVTSIFDYKDFFALILYDDKRSYLSIYPNAYFEKPTRTFAFKSEIGGLIRINKSDFLIACDNEIYTGSLSNDLKKINVPDLALKNIIVTSGQNIWVLTRGKGLYLYKSNQFIQMPFDEGGYLSHPNNLTKDSKGYLWISSNNGLFKVPEKKLLEYAENNKTRVNYYRYTKEDGFNINEFNGSVNSFTKLENGDLVVPTMDGYVFFDPLKIPSYYPKANNIYIERAKSKGSDYMYFKDTLNLENNFGSASVFIDIPYYANNENLYIEASLQRDDQPENWQRLKDKEFTLNDLSPGNYILNIRVLISPDGIFAYKKIQIHVPALFYETIWFRVLISILFLSFILFIIALRTRILTAKNNKLKKIVHQKNNELKTTQNQLKNESEYQKNLIQTINHDITTPIKYLSAMSQKLSETNNPKLQKQYFDTIYKSSEELYKFTLNLKNYTELFNTQSLKYQEENYDLFDIFETKKRLFEEIAFQKNSTIINNSSKDIKLNYNESILTAIIHNLLDNAVKNTSNGDIILDVKEEKGFVIINISDSGNGMNDQLLKYYNNLMNNIESKPTSFKNQGLGLHLVIQLLKKIDGKIVFKTHIPKGTQVEIIIQN